MIPILAITNDKRVLQTMRACRLRYKGRFETSSDFDQGLKAIFEWRPGLIFVQHELAGVSASVVARHVKGLLGSESPILIILSSGPIPSEVMKDLFDGAVSLNLPDQELTEALMLHIEQALGGEEGEGAPPVDNPMEILPVGDEVARMVGDMAKPHEPAAPPPETSPQQVITEPPAPLTPREKQASPVTLPPTRPSATEGPIYTGTAPLQRRDSSRRTVLLLVVLIGLTVLGTGLLLLNNFRHNTGTGPTPSSPSQAVKPQVPRGLSLPAAVQSAVLDPSFSASHPGWERRTSPGVEYRIFMEGAAVAAIQVMAAGSPSINEALFKEVLAGASGATSHSVASTAERGGFLIQQGVDSSGAEIELYRNQKTGELRGFVVSRSATRQ